MGNGAHATKPRLHPCLPGGLRQWHGNGRGHALQDFRSLFHDRVRGSWAGKTRALRPPFPRCRAMTCFLVGSSWGNVIIRGSHRQRTLVYRRRCPGEVSRSPGALARADSKRCFHWPGASRDSSAPDGPCPAGPWPRVSPRIGIMKAVPEVRL